LHRNAKRNGSGGGHAIRVEMFAHPKQATDVAGYASVGGWAVKHGNAAGFKAAAAAVLMELAAVLMQQC